MVDFIGRVSCRRRGLRKTLALPFAAAIAFASAVHAQAPKLSEQSLHFTVFSPRPVQGLGYAPRPSLVPTKVVFYPTARSPRYEFRGAMPLRFTDAGSGAVVAEVMVPPEIHDALLLFSPLDPSPATTVASGTLKYRVAVLDDGTASHATGGLAVINFSGLALSGTVDNRPVTLQDGLNATLNVGRSAKVLLKTTLKGRTYQSYTEDVKLKKNERALLILFPPFYKGSLEVQSRLLVDEPPEPPPAATSAR
jgi:hypothetical protein